MRAIAIVLLLGATSAAQPTNPPAPDGPAPDDPVWHELGELRAKLRDLEQRLADSESTPQPIQASPGPHFHVGHDGIVLGTADGKNEIRLHTTLHVDGRAYFGDTQPIPDTFLIRRARLTLEGTLFGIIDFRIMPNFAMGQAVLDDMFVELHPWPWLRLRAGKYRSPIGLEWLQSDSTLMLVERSLVTDLMPYRDLGVMLYGDVAAGTFCYALAVFNGAPDSTNGPDFDPQSDKDYVARIFLRPLRPIARIASFVNLGFGVAASYGQLKGTTNATNLPTYKSPGQQPIFTYINDATALDATVLPERYRWRVSPQAYLYIGPVGLLAEHIWSSQRVQRLGTVADIQNQAWNVSASLVLTMERASYDGVIPRRPVDFRHKNFGAFEVTFRYSELRFDPSAFPIFADPTVSVRSARELAGGLNWYLTDYVRFMLSFHHTDFVGGSMTGDREPENALLGRLQLAL